MAQYAFQLHEDDNAIRYAARAVELNPEDAEGHRRLAEMYRSRQDADRAIREFRAAIARNERLYVVYFELADLVLAKGDTDEADHLFRRVMRGGTDEEMVARAARLSMQINLGKGTLESLEQDLLPLAIDNPRKTVYRRLLVEIYESLTFGLVQRTRHGTGKDAADARAALARIGQRAVKPLLDALADSDEGQQRVAIDVLSYVQNKNAAPALFSFATGSADTPLRVRAMIACGALEAPELLPRFERYLLPRGKGAEGDDPPADAAAVAASWGVARMSDRRALPLLRELSRRGTPEMRALALLGLAMLHDRSSLPAIARIARSPESGNVTRAAAAYALGELGAGSETAMLASLAEGNDVQPREMALLALARLADRPADGSAGSGVAAMADATFAGSDAEGGRARSNAEAVRRAGSHALMWMATGPEAARRLPSSPLVVPEGALDVSSVLDHLVPDGFTSEDRARALLTYGDALQRAAVSAMETSGHGVRAVLDALGDGDGTLLPFVGPGDGSEAARARAREIARAVEPGLIHLIHDRDPVLRARAVFLLGRSGSDAALAAVVLALKDDHEAVERAALASIGSRSSPGAVEAVARIVAHHPHFSLRVLASEALGRLGQRGAGPDAARALREAATQDPYALVREAALDALALIDAGDAKTLAAAIVDADPEPRVRDAARAVLSRAAPARPVSP